MKHYIKFWQWFRCGGRRRLKRVEEMLNKHYRDVNREGRDYR